MMQIGMIGLGRMGANMVQRLDPVFSTLAPGMGDISRTPGEISPPTA